MTFSSMCLQLNAPSNSNRVIALRGNRELRLSDLRNEVSNWVEVFLKLPESSVAFYTEDAFECLVIVLAAWNAGKSVALLGDNRPQTQSSVQALGHRLLLLGQELGADGQTSITRSESSVDASAVQQLTSRQESDLYLSVFTSGSTGEPVQFRKSLEQLESEVKALEASLPTGGWSEGCIVASTVSQQHLYGFLFRVVWPFTHQRVFVAERLDLIERVQSLPRSSSVYLVSSPTHLSRLAHLNDWDAVRARLKAVFSSGGVLGQQANQSALDVLGHIPVDVYGSSETGGIAWRQSVLPDCTWTMLRGAQYRIEDGCLTVNSPWLNHAWYKTSDLAESAACGTFQLLGRGDRIVKVEGKRVSLAHVEQTLVDSGLVNRACVIQLPSEFGGRLGLVAEPSEKGSELLFNSGRKAFISSLKSSLFNTVDRLAWPRVWRFTLVLPENSQGKIHRSSLLALLASREPDLVFLERSRREVRIGLWVQADLPHFDGHFPGQPVLPGVALLDWAFGAARQCFSLGSHTGRLANFKFLKPVEPDERLHLHLSVNDASDRLDFKYSSGDATCAQGQFRIRGAYA